MPLPLVYLTKCLAPVATKQRVSPIDEPSANSTTPSTLSSLTVELSALTTTAFKTRLWECNLPASGNKAILIGCLQQSASSDETGPQHEQLADQSAFPDETGTQREQLADPAVQQTQPTDSAAHTNNPIGNT